MSMAAGEYVSVSSQSDAEQPDLARERMELSDKPDSSSMSLPTAINSIVSTMTAAKQGAAKFSFGCWETTANIPGRHRKRAAGETRPIKKNPKQSYACLGFRSCLGGGVSGDGAARLA